MNDDIRWLWTFVVLLMLAQCGDTFAHWTYRLRLERLEHRP